MAMQAPTIHDNTRTLVLTGASRGIGHATVKKFSAGGWRVITVSRQPFSVLCPWPGGGENHVQLDLADLSDVARGIEEIRERVGGGKLDALVNNAAISPRTRPVGALVPSTRRSTSGSACSTSISSHRWRWRAG